MGSGSLNTVNAESEATGSVSKSKTATALDSNHETTVTLSMPAEDYQNKIDVVLVIDKSETNAASAISQSIQSMVEKLSAYQNVSIKVGVVICCYDPFISLPLTELNSSSAEQSVIDATRPSGEYHGSNLHTGLVEADTMLSGDSAVNSDNKYVIVISDGLVYYWGDSSDTLKTIEYVPNDYSRDSAPTQYGTTQEECRKTATGSVVSFDSLYKDKNNITAEEWSRYDVSGKVDGKQYQGGRTVHPATDTDKTYVDYTDPNAKTVTAGQPTCVEKGIYMAASEYDVLSSKKYHCISLYWTWDGTNPEYALAREFMEWAGTNGKTSYPIDKDNLSQIQQIFSKIQDTLLHKINKATVTDPIDSHFSLVTDADIPFTLSVGGQLMTGSKTGDNTYVYGTADDQGVYPYTVTYDAAAKKFVWQINVPVTLASRVQLSYKLLLNDLTTSGTYPTNGETDLDAVSSENVAIHETFDVPSVSYSVGTAPTAAPTAGSTEKPSGRTCQDDGYPAGYYWNGTACVINTAPAATPNTTTARVPAATPLVTPSAAATPIPSATVSAAPSVTVSASPSATTTQPAYGREGGAWALLNLIMTIITMILAIFELFAKKEKEEDPDEDEETIRYDEDGNVIPDTYKRKGWYKAVLAVAAILQIVLFILTENMRLPMIIWDKWTLLNIIITVITAVLYAFARKWRKQDEEDDDTAEQTH